MTERILGIYINEFGSIYFSAFPSSNFHFTVRDYAAINL